MATLGMFPGLSKYGHREPNHNWMSAMMTGYMYGGKEGMYAAANHLMQDLIVIRWYVLWGPLVEMSLSLC
jgi:hypothetical protein